MREPREPREPREAGDAPRERTPRPPREPRVAQAVEVKAEELVLMPDDILIPGQTPAVVAAVLPVVPAAEAVAEPTAEPAQEMTSLVKAAASTGPDGEELDVEGDEPRRRRRRGGRNRNRREREPGDEVESANDQELATVDGLQPALVNEVAVMVVDAEGTFVAEASIPAEAPVAEAADTDAATLPLLLPEPVIETIQASAAETVVAAEVDAAAVAEAVAAAPEAPVAQVAVAEAAAPATAIAAEDAVAPAATVETAAVEEAVAPTAAAEPVMAEVAVKPVVAEVVVAEVVVTEVVVAEVVVAEEVPAEIAPAAAPLANLNAALDSAGLTLAATDPEKLRAAREAAAHTVAPVRVPRERKPLPPAADEPLVQIDTSRK
jgi:ribonuclease E